MNIGSWGTPEFGLTERLSNYFGQGRTAQGGSNMFGNQAQTTLVPSGSNSQGPTFAPSGQSGAYGITTNPQVLGLQTSLPVNTNPNTNPVNTNQNNGSNLSIRQQMEQGLIPWDDNKLNAAGGSPNAFNQEIDSAYQDSFDALGKLENYIKGYQPQFENQINSNYGLNTSELGNQKQAAIDRFNLQEGQAGYRRESALAAARRNFDEQSRGAQARFGGSSSAGGAVSELLARENMRQQGDVYRSYNDYAQNLALQRNEIERGYTTGIEKLRLQKDADLLSANKEFFASLQQINSDRASLTSQKGQLKLSALQDYRNKIFSIDQQERDFQNKLAMQKLQSQTALDAYSSSITGANTIADNSFNTAANGMNTNPQPVKTNYNLFQNPVEYVGQIFGKKDDPYK